MAAVRIGVADHLGWAVVVVATDDHEVVDRRRIELVDAGLPAAPIHHEGGAHELHRSGPRIDDDELAALVDTVRRSAESCARAAFERLVSDIAEPIRSLSLRTWPDEVPTDIATLRRAPWESRADPIVYRRVLATAAAERGWSLHRYEARTIEDEATEILGERAREVLDGPRAALGPPWTKDHRIALAATVCAGAD